MGKGGLEKKTRLMQCQLNTVFFYLANTHVSCMIFTTAIGKVNNGEKLYNFQSSILLFKKKKYIPTLQMRNTGK